MHKFIVESSGRLDKFLSLQFPDLSRSKLQKFVKSGAVFVDGEVVKKASFNLLEGVEVEFRADVAEVEAVLVAEDIELDVVYECERGDFLVINKPAGMVVHPGEGGEHMSGTVANAVKAMVDEDVGEAMRPGIVHRLDKDTSGLMIIAKTARAYEYFVDLFKARKLVKKYLTLVKGRLEHEEGLVDSPIARDLKVRKKMGVSLDGDAKEALTRYKVLDIYELDARRAFSLLEIDLLTGRTHQIRVHMSAIGHPVVADSVYGERSVNKFFAGLGLERQFLHAWKLEFEDLDGNMLKLEAGWPEDLSGVLEEF